jgi:hypothetical protein
VCWCGRKMGEFVSFKVKRQCTCVGGGSQVQLLCETSPVGCPHVGRHPVGADVCYSCREFTLHIVHILSSTGKHFPPRCRARFHAPHTFPCLCSGSASQADPSAALSFLCFANVPPPPPGPWSAAHKLLVAALRQGADCREEPQEGQALAAAADSLDIDW